MLRKFPEIEFFFKQSYFTQEDLTAFKEQLINTYLAKEESEKAMSLVKLFLLKFKLSTPQELEEFKKGKKRTKKKELKSNNKEEKSITTVLIVKSYKKTVIRNIQKKLKITVSDLNIELSRKNVQLIKNTNCYLSNSQFYALNNFFENKVEYLIKNPEKKKIVKQSKELKKALSFEDKLLKLTINKQLTKLANALGLKESEIIELFSLPKSTNFKRVVFSEGLWEENKIKIRRILEEIQKNENKKIIRGRSKKSSSSGGGVYDEIFRQGGLGKVIFIRTR
jgi:hypothetical protein